MILKQYWAHSGYDAEELYFAKINRELIDRIKQNQGKTAEKKESNPTELAEVIPFPKRKDQSKKAA